MFRPNMVFTFMVVRTKLVFISTMGNSNRKKKCCDCVNIEESFEQIHLLYTCWDTCYSKGHKSNTCIITSWSMEYFAPWSSQKN